MNEEIKPQSHDEILQEILKNTRKTKNYIKWQLIITVALVVLPLFATALLIPMALSSLGSVYGGAGLLQGIQ